VDLRSVGKTSYKKSINKVYIIPTITGEAATNVMEVRLSDTAHDSATTTRRGLA